MNPFSILDTRTKDWKSRKEWWITTYGIQSELGREETESRTMFWDSPTNVSIFDPVLCELLYNWFSPKDGLILDPFAGGSVRGIVAEELGRKYTGIDLSESQILANKKQSDKPNWVLGDSNNPNDISNMDVDSFDDMYKSILQKSVKKLKNNRFYGIVVSEVREPSITGKYSTGRYR